MKILFLLVVTGLVIPSAPLRAQPIITGPPTNQVVPLGGTVSLTVTASGDTPLAYQWFKDSRWLLNQTNNALTVTNAGVMASGTYCVLVTNLSGMVISQPVSVMAGNPSLLAWGNNNYGQLGNGTNTGANPNPTPANIAGALVAGAAGAQHSLYVTSDGTLWAMGENNLGQLGDGTLANTNLPISVGSNVVAAAAGNYFSLFLTADGSLWGMGQNNGQLGNGTLANTNWPILVTNHVVAVAAGQNHALFVLSDGTLWAMGQNTSGQLGNGTVSGAKVPIKVASNVVAVAGGWNHSLFVTSDGTLWAMGSNAYGQLGNGTTTSALLPVSVASNVLAVAAGASHTLFVKADGTLWTAGLNSFGQLGNGTTSTPRTPANVGSNVVAVAGGYMHSLFVKGDGTLWTMGENQYGQLGDGMATNTNLPVNVPHVSAVANVFAEDQASHSVVMGTLQVPASVTLGNLNQAYTGGAINATASTTPPGLAVNLTYNGSTLAPTNPGSYAVVGTIADPNYYGGVTNTLVVTWAAAGPTNQVVSPGGTLEMNVTVTGPSLGYQWFKDGRRLLGATNSTLVVANASVRDSGLYYAVATNLSGMVISLPALAAVEGASLLAWGFNAWGQVGDGTTNNRAAPVGIASNVVAEAAGDAYSLFVTTDSTLWGMGQNRVGQLGDGATNNTDVPVRITDHVAEVTAGGGWSMIVQADGTLWAMGNNGYGQFGTGAYGDNETTPIRSLASNVVFAAAGGGHSLLVKSDGTLWAAGNNQYGQLGNGSNTFNLPNPVPLCVASNVVAVAAGGAHSLFVKMDGTLWAMGNNGFGQLGNGATSNVNLPISVASNVVAVAAGNAHSLFVTAEGTLWAMGNNQYGQLGNGTNAIFAPNPIPTGVASNVMTMAAGLDYSVFVRNDGTLWNMGENNYGQLGDGATSGSNPNSTPMPVPQVAAANVFPANQAMHSLALGFIKSPAVVSLGNLYQLYAGVAINVTANTTPPGLAVSLTYMGSPLAPTNPGSYTVVGTINDPNYYGGATNVLVIGLPPQSFAAGNIGGLNQPSLTLQLSGTPGYPYVLQTATNLTPPVDWQSIFTNPADVNGNWSLTLSNLTGLPGGFYRAVAQ